MESRKKRHKQTHRADQSIRTSKHKTDENNPIQRLIEFQDHRYDLGYYTGGKIDPILAARRPNKYGYYLIICGAMTVLVVVLAIKAGIMPLYATFSLVAFLSLVFIAGFKLIRRQGAKNAKSRQREKIRRQ